MDIRIVNLRGIAILLVVLGHSIILYDPSWGLYNSDVAMPLFAAIKQHLINTIQMPIFFFISGFLLYKSFNNKKKIDISRFLRSKFSRLIIPYFCIAFLWMDPIKWLVGAPGFEDVQNFNDVIFHQTIFSGYLGHLWYLPTLFGVLTISFLCILFSYRIFKKLNHTYIHFTLFIIFLLLHYYASHLPTQLCISSIAYYLIYSQTGLCFNALITNKQLPSTKKAQYISLLCWAISFICSIYFVKTRVIFIIIFITLSYILLPSRTNKFINNISNNSYGIYLFHSPLIYITYTYFTNANPWIVLFFNFVVMGSLAYLLTIITNKSKLKFIIGN